MSIMSNMSKILANHLNYINVVNSSIAFVLYDSFNLIPNMTKSCCCSKCMYLGNE